MGRCPLKKGEGPAGQLGFPSGRNELGLYLGCPHRIRRSGSTDPRLRRSLRRGPRCSGVAQRLENNRLLRVTVADVIEQGGAGMARVRERHTGFEGRLVTDGGGLWAMHEAEE